MARRNLSGDEALSFVLDDPLSDEEPAVDGDDDAWFPESVDRAADGPAAGDSDSDDAEYEIHENADDVAENTLGDDDEGPNHDADLEGDISDAPIALMLKFVQKETLDVKVRCVQN